jgi:hypothetical protein
MTFSKRTRLYVCVCVCTPNTELLQIHYIQQSSHSCSIFRKVPGSNLYHWPSVLRSGQTGGQDRFLPHSCPFTSHSTCCYEVLQESVAVLYTHMSLYGRTAYWVYKCFIVVILIGMKWSLNSYFTGFYS